MSRKKKAAAASATAAEAVTAVKSNPYVQRVVEDDDLRDNVRVAYESAQSAFNRLSNGKGLPKALVEDKKLHKDLQQAADALRDVGGALLEAPKKKSKAKAKAQRKRGGFGRKLLLLTVGAGLAVALSSDLRNKLLDALFGAEEEFDYTSTTAPSAAPAPARARCRAPRRCPRRSGTPGACAGARGSPRCRAR